MKIVNLWLMLAPSTLLGDRPTAHKCQRVGREIGEPADRRAHVGIEARILEHVLLASGEECGTPMDMLSHAAVET
jgi:hypothetical protein